MGEIARDLEAGLIAAGAIGLMLSLSALGLNNLIQKNPLIWAIGFVILIVKARKISNGGM